MMGVTGPAFIPDIWLFSCLLEPDSIKSDPFLFAQTRDKNNQGSFLTISGKIDLESSNSDPKVPSRLTTGVLLPSLPPEKGFFKSGTAIASDIPWDPPASVPGISMDASYNGEILRFSLQRLRSCRHGLIIW